MSLKIYSPKELMYFNYNMRQKEILNNLHNIKTDVDVETQLKQLENSLISEEETK